jgi:Na+-driven multidrug efflux pump
MTSDPRASVTVLLRRILALAAPTTLVVVLQILGMLAETWLAARQGTLALSAWAVVLPFAQVMSQMSAGAMGGGVVSAVARTLGAGRGEEAAELVTHALLIALGFAAAFVLGLVVFPRAILGAIAGAEVAEAAAPYAMWLFGLGAVPFWLTNTLASVLRGGGRHGLAARVLVIAWAIWPPLAWLLMEPLGLGLPGSGIAFGLVFWGAVGVMGAVVARGGAGFHPRLFVRPRRTLFWRILSVGLLACTLAAIANLTVILLTARFAGYGVAAVAAYGIVARLEFLMVPLAFGLGSALTALVGRAVGGGDWETARRTAWTGGLVAFGLASAAGLFVALVPEAVARAFSADPAVVSLAMRGLAIVGPAFGGFGLGMALYFASLGAGRMRWPLAAGLSRIVLAVGGGSLLAEWAGLGVDGYFLGVALGITAYGAFTAAAVRPGVWPGRAAPVLA